MRVSNGNNKAEIILFSEMTSVATVQEGQETTNGSSAVSVREMKTTQQGLKCGVRRKGRIDVLE